MISFWKMVNPQDKAYFPEDIGLSCQVNIVENAVWFAKKSYVD